MITDILDSQYNLPRAKYSFLPNIFCHFDSRRDKSRVSFPLENEKINGIF